jgi:uncharacterized ion transporter superfamily protein YfcC
MAFFLITFLLSFAAIFLTWFTNNPVGITNVFQCFHRTAAKILKDQGLSIFIFAFFLYALLQSKALQSLFATQRKWLQKRKYFTIALITFLAALLSSNLSWFDEFIHFYPLIIPLIMTMGFDLLSSVLCLYGGSIPGLIGLVSTGRMQRYFENSFDSVKGKINYNGLNGIGFRIFAFFLLVSIVILFNIWYCSRNKQKFVEENNLNEQGSPPPFTRTKKIILAVAGFFLLGAILAQVSPIAKTLKTYTDKVHPIISSEYEGENVYNELGEFVGKMKISEVKENKKGYWGTFGDWEHMSIDCWLLIGGIIICLLAREKIIKVLIKATQLSIPIVLVYIFAAVPAEIIRESGLVKGLENYLPDTASPNYKWWILLSIFGICAAANFFLDTTFIGSTLVSALAPVIIAFSSSILIYAAIFAWMGTILGISFSPNNGILMNSLEKSKVSYKQFIKKTWILWLIMSLTVFGLVLYQISRIK